MVVKKFKSIGIPRTHEDNVVDLREKSAERRKETYWVLRRSDELLLKANKAIARARKKLNKFFPPPPQED